jgi:uncharacterized protein involved in exopolysaccharide biosynthesis
MGGRRAIESIGRGWKVISVTALVGFAAAVAISALVPATYVSEARLLVADPVRALEASAAGIPAESADWVETQAETLRWRAMHAEVVRRLHLDATPEEVSDALDVARVDDSQVVAIRAHWRDRRTAADIANTLAAVYITSNRDRVARSLAERAGALSAQMDAVERGSGVSAAIGRKRDATPSRRAAEERLTTLAAKLEQVRLFQRLLPKWGVLMDAAVPATRRSGPTAVLAALIGAVSGFLLGGVLVLLPWPLPYMEREEDAPRPPVSAVPPEPSSLERRRAKRERERRLGA